MSDLRSVRNGLARKFAGDILVTIESASLAELAAGIAGSKTAARRVIGSNGPQRRLALTGHRETLTRAPRTTMDGPVRARLVRR